MAARPRTGRRLHLALGLAASLLAAGGAASAQSLTGTWDIGGGTGQAKCRVTFVDGTTGSGVYALGPLEITQNGNAIYVRSLARALHYQGVFNVASNGDGSAIATSCDALTVTASDVPGTFLLDKASPLKGAIKGSFVGRWQTTGAIIACKFSATRLSQTDPAIAACP